LNFGRAEEEEDAPTIHEAPITDNPTMAQYYLSKNGQQSGPFTQQQIDQMLQSGWFSGTELYRREDSADWKSIAQLPGFVPPPVPPFAGTPAPAPVPAKSSCLLIGLIGGAVALILVTVIALLAAIAVPGFLRARKRSQATRVLNDLRMIDSAIDQYAISHNKKSGARVEWADIQNYLPADSHLSKSGDRDILGNRFGPEFTVDSAPTVPAATYRALSDVAPAEFWSPFKEGRGDAPR
jgi:type II secretory pathway pseudopilin PulG